MELIVHGWTSYGLVQVFERTDHDCLAEYHPPESGKSALNELFSEEHPEDSDRRVCPDHYAVQIGGKFYDWEHSNITPHDRTIVIKYPPANITGRARLYMHRGELAPPFESFNSERLTPAP